MIKSKNLIVRILIFNILLLLLATGCEDINSDDDKNDKNTNVSINHNQINDAIDVITSVPGIRTLVISHEGEIISENYFNGGGPDPDPVLHVMSATKSIVSLLTGIAIEMGYLDSVEQKIGPFLSQVSEVIPNAYYDLTIEDLLTMRAGDRWAEIDEPTEFYDFIQSPNQLEYILDKPIEDTPGTVFDYSDGAAHLMSIVLTNTVGMATTDFADKFLFEPLDIGPRYWQVDKQSFTLGGIGLLIGATDMITLGEMVLNDGQHNGKQIISSEWIEKSTTFKTSTNNVVAYGPKYGYYWWIGNGGGHDYYYASGHGGQLIVIVDALSLVITSTCDYRGVSASGAGNNWWTIMTTIVNEIITAFD